MGLRPDKITFLTFWQMSQTFYMRTLQTFLDQLCLDNFGWFYSSLGRGGAMQYLVQWDPEKLASMLQNRKFRNCNEEQIFDAVLCYCKTKSDTPSEDLPSGSCVEMSCVHTDPMVAH